METALCLHVYIHMCIHAHIYAHTHLACPEHTQKLKGHADLGTPWTPGPGPRAGQYWLAPPSLLPGSRISEGGGRKEEEEQGGHSGSPACLESNHQAWQVSSILEPQGVLVLVTPGL